MSTHIETIVEPAVQAAAVEKTGDADKHSVMLPIGIPGYTLREEARQVPLSEPPVLPINDKLAYIGKPTERWDGQFKVSGQAKYTADIQLPGMLYGVFINANVPHARVVSVDTSAADKYPGVKSVQVIEHVQGNAELRDPKLEVCRTACGSGGCYIAAHRSGGCKAGEGSI
jgi:xanthine dehydrogenase YagR molybdenum-binding subunit